MEDFTFGVDGDNCSIFRVVNVGGHQIHKKDDILFFHIHMLPSECEPFKLRVYYLKTPVLTFHVLGKEPRKELKLKGRTFLLYDTHQLEIRDDETLKTVFLTLENNKISFDDIDMDPQVEPHLPFLFEGVPGVVHHSMDYLPLHPFNDTLMENTNLVMYPQRTPMWFVTRNLYNVEVSSSNVGKFAAGYWLDNEPATPTIKDQLRKESNMRFGRIHEDAVMLITMYNYPTWEFFEVGRGFFSGKEQGLLQREDVAYASSRDGYALIPDITETFEDYPEIDPRRCVLEFKASYSSSAFPDYYIPQLYWEMIEGNAAQAMLVRYKRRRAQVGGVWKLTHQAHAYVVRRDPRVEAMIVRNVNASLSRAPRTTLVEHINNNYEPYAELRETLAELAKSTKGIPLKIPEQLLDSHTERRRTIIKECSFN